MHGEFEMSMIGRSLTSFLDFKSSKQKKASLLIKQSMYKTSSNNSR